MDLSEVSRWTRLTHRLNVLVWAAPLPERVKARLSAIVYRNPPMPAARVAATMAALESAGVRAWMMGGWGIDALVGRESRPHRDLDVIVDHPDIDAALHVLRGLGFEEWHRHPAPDAVGGMEAAGDNIAMRDPSMLVVDVHDIDVRGLTYAFTSGVVAGQTIGCLTADQQIMANTGFRKRLPNEQMRVRSNLQLARKVAARNGSDA